ncbi:hypothetical protein [Shewanella sp. SR43-8]|nr:hypothetical protein [Shewanella sp. SR43-8]MBB1322113.1 hypothetical protein [Shewanella sp. SR43-8]
MFNDLPTDFAVDVRTPDPVVVRLQPSNELIAVLAFLVVVLAAWVKRR